MADYTRSVVEGATTQDSTTKYSTILRSATSYATCSSSPKTTSVLSRIAIDAISITSTASRSVSSNRIKVDVVVISDTSLFYSVYSKSSIETVTLNSSFSTIINYHRYVTSSSTINDLSERAVNSNFSNFDTVALNDIPSIATNYYKYTTSSSAVNDATEALLCRCRAAVETSIVASTFLKYVNSLRISTESSGVGDTPIKIVASYRYLSEVVIVNDVPKATLCLCRSTSEASTLVDSHSYLKGYLRIKSEIITGASTPLKYINSQRTATEAKSINDSVGKTVASYRSLMDVVTVSSTPKATLCRCRSVSETITLTDINSYIKGYLRSNNETITSTDSQLKYVGSQRLFSEFINISSTAKRIVASYKSTSEVSTLADTHSYLKCYLRVKNETFTKTDAFARTVTSLRSSSAVVAVNSSVEKYVGYQRLKQDLITATASIDILKIQSRTNVDTFIANDPSLTRIVQTIRYPFSYSNASDFARRSITIEFQFSTEAVTVTVMGRGIKGRELFNLSTISATDSLSTSRDFKRLNISILQNALDIPNTLTSSHRSAIETLTCSDIAAFSKAIVRIAQELITISAVGKRIGYRLLKAYDTANVVVTHSKAANYLFKVYEKRYPIVVSYHSVNYNRGKNEIVTVNLSESKNFSFNRGYTDTSLIITDTSTIITNYVRLLPDNSSVLDSSYRQVYSFRIKTDQKAITDYLRLSRGFYRTNAETLASSDSHKLPYNYDQFKINVDHALIADSTQNMIGANRSKIETSSVIDQIAIVKGYYLTVNDAISATESTRRIFSKIRTHLDQTYEVNDYGRRTVNYVRSKTENVTITTSKSIKINFVRFKLSEATLASSKSITLSLLIKAYSGATSNDVTAKYATFFRSREDQTTINEVFTRIGYDKVKYAFSACNVIDLYSKQVNYHRLRSDQASISDSRSKQHNYVLTNVENVNLNSSHRLPYNYDQVKTNADYCSVIDYAYRTVHHVRSEIIAVTVRSFTIRGTLIEIAENVTLNSIKTVATNSVRRAIDYTYINEYLCYPKTRIRKEAINIADIATVRVPTKLSASATFDPVSNLLVAIIGLPTLNGQSYRDPPKDCRINVYFCNEISPSFTLYPDQAKSEGYWVVTSRLTRQEEDSNLVVRVSVLGGNRVGSVSVNPLIVESAVPQHVNPM